MSGVDLFGRSNSRVVNNKSVKLKSNGGIELNNDALLIKLDSNKNIILSLSSAGLMSKFSVLNDGGVELSNEGLSIKLDHVFNNMLTLSSAGLLSSLSENLKMTDNKITGLDFTYPPSHKTKATCWDQVKQCVEKQSILNWGIDGNSIDSGVLVKLGTKSDNDIHFIRNDLAYFTLKSNEIRLNK